MNIYFESYGCTLNSGEAQRMKNDAEAAGHIISNDYEKSDLIVLLTCTVIEPTELKMQRRLKELYRPGKQLVIAGCMANVQPERLTEIAPEAVIIPTPGQVEGFNQYLINHGISKPEVPQSTATTGRIQDHKFLSDGSVPVPIAEGCIGSCTYCITRLARGGLRSYPEETILEDIKHSVERGACEIRLTAQDSAAYGTEDTTGVKLPPLLEKICEIRISADDGRDFRIRVGMMNPNTLEPIIEELLEVYKQPRIFSFLHLPVQSGSNKILSAMGRNYDVDLFKGIVRRFREALPELTLSTDIITGFPGEDEDDHLCSVELLNVLRPNIVNITRFSERPGTPAVDLTNKVHGRTSKARSRELTGQCKKISYELNEELIGTTQQVLTTERNIGQYQNTTLARTKAYRPVVIDKELELGNCYKVKIESVTEAYLRGKLI